MVFDNHTNNEGMFVETRKANLIDIPKFTLFNELDKQPE